MNAAVPEPASADAIENPLEPATLTLPVEAMTRATRVARVEGLAGVMDTTAIDDMAGAAANRLSAPARSR